VEDLKPVVPIEPDAIGKRLVTRFIEEKITDGNKEYTNTKKFRADYDPILRYFKKDMDYAKIPNDLDNIFKLFEDDERVIIEIRKKGNSRLIKMTRAES